MMIEKCYRLRRKNIAIVQHIIEGYEGMASVTTIDPRLAVIRISMMKDFISPMEDVIADLKNTYEMEEIIIYPIGK
jgi:hypothetical protein